VIFEVGILESAFRARVPGDAILLRLEQLRHSSSVFTTFGTVTTPSFFPASSN